MELPVKIQSVIKVDGDGFICCSGKEYVTLLKSHQQKQAFKIFQAILDGLGALSAKAQALKQIITSSIKFIGTDHRIYIKVKDNKALGFVKVGEKNLFYRDFVILQLQQIGNIKEMKPTCILDIYVHQSCQRSGIGKEVFEKFLKSQHKIPDKLAYDRPSEKLLSFLKKYYGLVKYIPQNNNFVIYDRYFNKQSPTVEPIQSKPTILTPQFPNMITNSQPKLRPKTNIPLQKVQKIQEFPTGKSYQKIEEKIEPRRQFQQFQKFQQAKHKNNNSEGFPLSVTVNENPTFRTTSGAYGNHYQKKP